MRVALWTYLDLLREFKEALVNNTGVGVMGAFFGVFPLFACTDVFEVLLTGLGFDSPTVSPIAAKRDRFGEGGGRLHEATDQHLGGLREDYTHKTSTRFGLVPDPFW